MDSHTRTLIITRIIAIVLALMAPSAALCFAQHADEAEPGHEDHAEDDADPERLRFPMGPSKTEDAAESPAAQVDTSKSHNICPMRVHRPQNDFRTDYAEKRNPASDAASLAWRYSLEENGQGQRNEL